MIVEPFHKLRVSVFDRKELMVMYLFHIELIY